jgi:DNA-binding NtrC family response regulator
MTTLRSDDAAQRLLQGTKVPWRRTMQDALLAHLVGAEPIFLESVRVIRKLAATNVTALIQGETGTGKELAARAIHYLGARRDYPFIPVNCGALPDNLIENELFGHVRGAFTDAREARSGVIASAEGGTLFLDEIECLTPRAQVVLLRFIQDRAYRPLGGRDLRTANVRIITASNANVGELVRAGSFRRDLMYRLDVFPLTMPPLRDRPRDIPLLAAHFLSRFAREYRQEEKVLDHESVALLTRHTWPGNVRELENVIHRELLMTDGRVLHLRSLPWITPATDASRDRMEGIAFELGFRRAKAVVIAEFEKAFLSRAMVETGGNVSRAARLAGKDRRAFSRLLKKHGLRQLRAPALPS